jgi:hypothetical protein
MRMNASGTKLTLEGTLSSITRISKEIPKTMESIALSILLLRNDDDDAAFGLLDELHALRCKLDEAKDYCNSVIARGNLRDKSRISS